jgi:uncharacterized protein YuzE
MAMATQTGPQRQFQRDETRGDQYVKISDRSVAYSVELSDLVIADYDETGAVRGIEFVGKRTEPLDTYLDKAQKASRGPMRKRPQIPT